MCENLTFKSNVTQDYPKLKRPSILKANQYCNTCNAFSSFKSSAKISRLQLQIFSSYYSKTSNDSPQTSTPQQTPLNAEHQTEPLLYIWFELLHRLVHSLSRCVGALAGDVAKLLALVAHRALRGLGALLGDVAKSSTVVALDALRGAASWCALAVSTG